MNGIYYKTPLKFSDLMNRRELDKTDLENSIAQYINIVATTSFGECKFDDGFGCAIWEADFDILADSNSMRLMIKEALIAAIKKYETRLLLNDVEITIAEDKIMAVGTGLRMKKKVVVLVKGRVKKTNRPFDFYGSFFLGPLSYL